MNERVLVTGATGFIGSHLVNELKKDNDVVSLTHHPVRGKWQEEALDGTIKTKVDIRCLKGLRRVIARYEVDRVYHTAALCKVKTAYKDPMSVYEVNVMGTVALLEACGALGVDRILVINTDKVYGEGMKLDESNPFVHNEPYATSKSCQGLIVDSCIDTYDMNIVMPHLCNVFGYDPYSNRIVPNTVKKCLNGQSPIIFTNDDSLREYIYIDDVVKILIDLMEGELLSSVNIPTEWVYNQREVVRRVLGFFPDLEAEYAKVELPPQIEEESLASKRIQWNLPRSFNEALAETVAKFRKYEEDWK